jgi:hypothetical protein
VKHCDSLTAMDNKVAGFSIDSKFYCSWSEVKKSWC